MKSILLFPIFDMRKNTTVKAASKCFFFNYEIFEWIAELVNVGYLGACEQN